MAVGGGVMKRSVRLDGGWGGGGALEERHTLKFWGGGTCLKGHALTLWPFALTINKP